VGEQPVAVYVALGGNLGDVLATFRAALKELEVRVGRVEEVSPAFRTVAVVSEGSNEENPDYWNVVTRLRTVLAPRPLLHELLTLETAHGRERGRRWAPRTLDLDLLLYGDAVIEEPDLVVPHPRLAERGFILRPLCEIDPDVWVPSFETTAGSLLGQLKDRDHGILYRLANWWQEPGQR
jgi:2-amino-4-hydroxy-6-hydroxymethyldihydropteridine diphosphokinase